jgi:site-specific recombinase XerD
MEPEVENMRRDLALRGYAERTQQCYTARAEHLMRWFGRAASDLSRDELRTYVEQLVGQEKSASWLCNQLCALRFLYQRTLGRPELVSFISLPRRYSPLPAVLSQGEVHKVRIPERLEHRFRSDLNTDSGRT